MKIPSFTKYIIILALIVMFQDVVARISMVASPSMEDTLLVGDAMMVLRYHYGLRLPFTDTVIFEGHKPERGDIILGVQPGHDGPDMVKRCVAVSGDTIEIRKKKLYVNGNEVPLPTEGKHGDSEVLGPGQAPRDYLSARKINGDSLFVLGDNRDFSYDSRLWGNLPEKLLRGKVTLILWSVDPAVSWLNPREKFRKGRFVRHVNK